MPQDKGPQADLDRIIHARPGEINTGPGSPEPFDEFFDFRLEFGFFVKPLRILNQNRLDEGDREGWDDPSDRAVELARQSADMRSP